MDQTAPLGSSVQAPLLHYMKRQLLHSWPNQNIRRTAVCNTHGSSRKVSPLAFAHIDKHCIKKMK